VDEMISISGLLEGTWPVKVVPTHGMDEYSSASWVADLIVGLEAVSNIIPEARSLKYMQIGDDHASVSITLIVLQMVLEWKDSDVLPSDATF
jgi:hypothetical protein